MDIVNYVIDYCTQLLSNGGIFIGFFMVFIECFIPALPLSIFVALNVNAFGLFLGTFISWIATSIGSFLCYLLFSFLGEKVSEKFLHKRIIKKVHNGIEQFQKITLSQLVLLITLPFTPAFLINILSGLAGVSREKFFMSIFIGKIFAVIFWGYIGKSLIESLTDFNSIIYIVFALIVSYIISKIVSKKMNIA